MRFGVTANDGGSCYPPVDNNRNYFKNNEHTLGYGTHEGASVTTFERRYPSYNENGELEFPNFQISEGYWEDEYGEKQFFPSGIWRASKGKIKLFGISEVIRDGFVNGIDLTQDDYSKEIAIQDFLTRFTDYGIASRKMFTFETLLDRIYADAGDAEVVNVLIQTCSGLDTNTEAGRELSEAWRGQSDKYPPYKI